VIEKKTVAEFKTEDEADAYCDGHLPMENEDYQKQVVEFCDCECTDEECCEECYDDEAVEVEEE